MKTQKKSFKQLQCSPRNFNKPEKYGGFPTSRKTTKRGKKTRKKTNKGQSCYTTENILLLKKHWNARHPDKKIHSRDKKKIWEKLKYYMQDVCSEESCWLKQKFMHGKNISKILSHSFAPKSPASWKKNKNEWLSSLDIEKIMKQYEREYKEFAFLGPSPIDFDTHMIGGECVWQELCEFKLKKYIDKGKNKIGIVFNMDPHYKGGSHWMSMFIDIPKKFIFYFDSNGDKIPAPIMVLVTRIQEQAKQLGIKLKFAEGYPLEHQETNTECGIYALFMIIQLLTGKRSYQYFKKHKITDKEMEALRKKYFNESS